MNKILTLLFLLFVLNSYSQSNANNKYLKSFLEEFPMYKDKIDNLYFEHIGMNRPHNTKQYFNVYSKEMVNQTVVAKFYYKNQYVSGRIQYILFPVVYSTYSPTVITDPNYKKPNVSSEIKCIIMSQYGVFVKPISQLRTN